MTEEVAASAAAAPGEPERQTAGIAVDPLPDGDPRQIHQYALSGRIPGRHVSDVFVASSGPADLVLKMAPTASCDDPAAREQFARELRNAKRVRSQRVAKIIDSGEWNGRPYIVQELVTGPTLAEMLDDHRPGPLDTDDAARLATGLAEALARLHEADVVHRDLTLANVIVNPERGPVLVDFGISRTSDDPRITNHGFAMGTPGYMSPEQLRGERPSHASDVFQWGIVVGQAMLGRHPIVGVLDEEHRLTEDWQRAQLAARTDPSLHGRLGRLVEQALEREPSHRPSSAALSRDIHRTSLVQTAGETAAIRLPPPRLADARTPREAWRASAELRSMAASTVADRWWGFALAILAALLSGWLVGTLGGMIVAGVTA